ncbi:hypothetical protein AVEN_217378-1 [Araneus ventricosus]|uniref:Tc1-like transposase DDE domain-containing protein n=1 Tax=Araneus ventricosus TaxID=182803 RepID=A0A4Y2HWU4_ARAVE|nr:hypothetical protein AVEN_217378-1 [Araneus ventricosus]
MDKFFPEDNGIFQDHNARMHRSRIVDIWLQEHENSLVHLNSPLQNLDLNPITNLWDVLERALRSCDGERSFTVVEILIWVYSYSEIAGNLQGCRRWHLIFLENLGCCGFDQTAYLLNRRPESPDSFFGGRNFCSGFK